MTKTYTQFRIWKMAGLVLVIFLSMVGFKGVAQPLLVENFDYTIGSLLTENGWTAHSGEGNESIDVTNGLIFSGYAGSGIGGAANLDNNGEDVNKTFTEMTTGTVYAAFVVQTQAANASGYFIHFGQSTIATTYFTRIYVSATGDGIGLGLGNTPPATYSPVTPGIPALVVIKLDIDTKVSSIYVFNSFPASEPTTPDGTVTETASFSNVGSIALRQFNAAEKVIVDGIRVADNWAEAVAPSSGSTPVISASPGTLSGFVYSIGNGPSVSLSYNLSGVDLTPAFSDITVTPTANFEISLDNASFVQTPILVPYSNGMLSPTPIYVRLKAGLAAGHYNGEMISNAGGGATTANVTCNGLVEAPATTTLPYSEDFATGFGLCYTYSVSGPAQYWKHSSTNEYAYMNGYNTGVLEEDWMVLPAVNFVTYPNVRLSFESYMNYGADDADNYFKLVYSTNYAGIGDPSMATWTEIPFDYPTELSTWTPSGSLNLSAITGSSIYIAFKYHYNVDFYRSWQIDNISMINLPLGIDNPVSEIGKIYTYGKELKIELVQPVNGLINVYNSFGQQVAEFKLNGSSASFNLNLPAGIFIVRIESNKGSNSAKVILR
jgi:hypothetical protein